MVQMRGVRKAFNIGQPNQTEVLHGVDLTLKRGEFCAVMGPSGSGKSTLLNIVGLLDRPGSGTLSICGEETVSLKDAELTRLRGHNIGFVFQYHCLLTACTAPENVMMPLLDSVGLSQWRDNLAGNLSGGQQQRVAVARALAMNPPLLLADEPTGNLDTKSADGVFDLFRKVNREHGTAILFVTHNDALAARCDRTIRVIDGLVTDHAAPAGA